MRACNSRPPDGTRTHDPPLSERVALSTELRRDVQARLRVTAIRVGDLVESESGERRRVARIERTFDAVILFDEEGECLILGEECPVTVVERSEKARG